MTACGQSPTISHALQNHTTTYVDSITIILSNYVEAKTGMIWAALPRYTMHRYLGFPLPLPNTKVLTSSLQNPKPLDNQGDRETMPQ